VKGKGSQSRKILIERSNRRRVQRVKTNLILDRVGNPSHVALDHLPDEGVEVARSLPAERLFGFRGVTEEEVDLAGSEVLPRRMNKEKEEGRGEGGKGESVSR
jgi:hypothetical protein